MRFLLTPLREGRPPRFPGIPRRDSYFYSRPCGRGDHRPAQLPEGLRSNFYSRPCGRGDFSQSPVGPPGVISTHAPAGGATKPYFLINLIFSLFLLTPLREGRPAAGRDRKKNGRDFYSRPCGRGDRRRGRQVRADQISTHAPAGGATSWCCALFLCMRISTHAPAGGATHRKLLPVRPYYISTHAPAGGATFRRLASTCRWSLFLLTPLREGRLAIFMILQLMTVYFYSRPCGRGDQTASVAKLGYQPISTHAPAGGATGVASV